MKAICHHPTYSVISYSKLVDYSGNSYLNFKNDRCPILEYAVLEIVPSVTFCKFIGLL